jgi:hypothetical protein
MPKHRVVIEEPVAVFIAGLAPEPRRLARAALRRFERGEWDDTHDWPAFHKLLEGRLTRFGRLRAGRLRLVYADATDEHGPVKKFFHAGWRGAVYDALEQMIAADALRQLGL